MASLHQKYKDEIDKQEKTPAQKESWVTKEEIETKYKELERFAKGLVPKKKVVCLSECKHCDFVYSGNVCLNCQV